MSYKLTIQQAREIRTRLAAGDRVNKLMVEYGVSRALIGIIRRGLIWKDKPCAYCKTPFYAVNSQTYCSLPCALWSRVEKGSDDECWPWNGAKSYGYGDFNWNGKHYRTNRVTYEITKGSLGDLHACHSCDNPSCCNPRHLFAGTRSDNMQDKLSKGRANMPRGINHWKAKLTEVQVAEIRQRLRGGETQFSIAAAYGVKRHVIADIKSGRAYRHLGV